MVLLMSIVYNGLWDIPMGLVWDFRIEKGHQFLDFFKCLTLLK